MADDRQRPSANTSRDAIFALLRDTKWPAAVSLFLSAVLFFPSQIQELYRSVLADLDLLDLVFLYFPLLMIGVFIWFGANQAAAASEIRNKQTTLSMFIVRFWPAFLGALPLASSALAKFSSVPTRFKQAEERFRELINTPGSVWDKLDVELARSVGEGLLWSGSATLLVAIIFLIICGLLSIRMSRFAQKANEQYFASWRFLALSLALIGILTAAFVLFPVELPQLLGVFGIMALFTLCVVAFCTHLSLMTINHRVPFIPILFICAAAFSILDLNDNHQVRVLENAVPLSDTQSDTQLSVENAFEKWYMSRPDRQAYFDEYPVYIVAAEGGGIYAAYQTGIFLARMQDSCPAFRDHLFAISAVSGGSVGASVFASGLQLLDSTGSATKPAGPCPEITRFLNRQIPPGMGEPKQIEKYVRTILSSDLLSPLVAAAVFPDFSQRFLPFRAPFLFDRASALEYALEAAADRISATNLLKQSYLSHWSPDGSSPALLFNATDVGSGRRVLFSPFVFGVGRPTDQVNSLIHFQTLRKASDGSSSEQSQFDLRLSTAAFISARFPWITPAATVRTKDQLLFGPVEKIRLVDGGYVDNSGVETALNLKEALETKIKELNKDFEAKRAASTDKNEKYPRIVVKLIVLSSGTYPTRNSFALGETLEPIRALLSTRQSRAYVAINQAARAMPPFPHPISIHGTQEIVRSSNFRLAKLGNHYYDLPLGWTVSLRTRDIIERQSGRYWDCEFNRNFTQVSLGTDSETDCVQLLVYHELNQSLPSAIVEVATANHYREQSSTSQPLPIRISDTQKNEIVRCYVEVKPWRLSQSHVIHALLDQWSYYPLRTDDRMLAYVLGTAAHETLDFRVFSEELSIPSAERIFRVFRHRIASLEQAATYVNDPEKLANFVYGNRPDLGNINEGDGWRYRARGVFPIWGRSNYRSFSDYTSTPLEAEPDLVLNRFVGARVAFAFFFVHVRNRLDPYFDEKKELWEEARASLPGLPKKDGLPEGAKEVATNSKSFFECIKRSKR